MTMTLVETKTLASNAAGILFSSIPQDATDLLILFSIRTTRAANDDLIPIKINGLTTNQSERELYGNGSSVGRSAGTNAIYGYGNGNNGTSNTFSNGSFYIFNYTGATAKSVSVDSVDENNATAAYQSIVSGLWNSTAAITSIELYSYFAANLVTGSTVSLYKITKGSSGGVVVS